MAVRQGMTINSYYSGRYDQDQLTYFCSEVDRIKEEGLNEDTAYVFSPEIFRSFGGDALHFPKHQCREVEGYILCTRPDI
jgi:hypothetical protein